MYHLTILTTLLLALPSVLAQSGSGCTGSVATTNGGRKIGIVIDSSGSMTTTDPQNLRIAAGKAITASLITSSSAGPNGHPDQVTVIDFDDSVTVVYPLGDPAGASFAGIDSLGGTHISLGVEAAIDQIANSTGSTTAGLSGIVVLTDGEDGYVTQLVTQLQRAKTSGIRVSFGFLSPSDSTASQSPSILSAILATGGIYTTISDSAAQATFVNLVLSHGLTDTDVANTGSSLLLPGLLTAGNVSASSGPEGFTYDAVANEVLNFTVSAISQGQTFDATLRDKSANKDVGAKSTTPSTSSSPGTGDALITYTATAATTLELSVSTKNTTAGLFSVSLSSSLNRTISVCGVNPNGTVGGGNETKTNATGTGVYTVRPTATFVGAAAVERVAGPVLFAVLGVVGALLL